MHYSNASLVQRGPSSWRASFFPVFDDGTRGERVFVTLSGCTTRREAKHAAEEKRAELEEAARSNLEEKRETPTLEEYQSAWAQNLLLTGAVIEKTAAGYVRGIVSFGDIAFTQMHEITEQMVRESIRAALDDGMSPNTVASNFHLMKSALSRAQEEGLISANPCAKVKPPKRVSPKPRSLTAEERLLVLSALPSLSGPIALAIRMALTTGVRGEECRGFTWEDWDPIESSITVRRAVVEGEKGEAIVKSPKTTASLRTLPVGPGLAQALEERRKWQEDRCSDLGITFSRRLFILGDIDGSPYTVREMQRDFAAVRSALGLECQFHWLRHTFATCMIARGVNVRTVAQ